MTASQLWEMASPLLVGYVRSTVRDMLSWSKAAVEVENIGQLRSFNGVANRNGLEASEQVLQQIAYIRSAKRPMIDEKSDLVSSCALGWFRHTLFSLSLDISM